MRRIKALLLTLAAVLAAGCSGIDRPFEGTYDQVVIYCALGHNNLSGDLRRNLDDLSTDVLPGLSYDKAIVAFMHNTGTGGYSGSNPPVLIRLFRGPDGKPVLDTLKTYSAMSVSASKESLRTVLEDIRTAFPARRYGMVYSSHGTGWLPADYDSNTEPGTRAASLASSAADGPAPAWPPTKALGNQYVGSRSQWVEIQDLAEALPMQFEYIALDCCLSGCIEVAWELRDRCRWLVVSPAEILTTGMVYSTLSRDMLSGPDPDLLLYCQQYYDYYNAQSGALRSGTITLVDCAKLEPLATAFSAIVDAHRDALDINKLSPSVQRYFYGSSQLRFFFDLRDLCAQIGATADELARLDAALRDCIPYHAETPSFFDLPLERCCGLSVYIPDPRRTLLNSFYQTLSWNDRVRLVR